MSHQLKVGWIGLGVMGFSMANHLLDKGLCLSVYSRTKEKANPLLDKGVNWVNSPAELVEEVDYLFSMVGYPSDVESIYFDANGVFRNLGEGKILIDMTTSSPALAERISRKATELGSFSLDAPVSGGDIGAQNASLAIMCGGDRKIYDQSLNLLQIMGKNVQFFGPAGSGQRVKMSNQILIASTMIGTVESLLYAERANLDLGKVIDLIGKGAAGCWSLNQLGPRMVNEDWAPGFYVKHFIKDMGIALEDAEKMNLKLKGLELAMTFYEQVKNAGHSENGTQVLMNVLRDLNEQ
jgi:3-hydroxyisobutyrate dehydrogenase|tara:strand:- start:5 stop:889 length:885 start_codon:yes stop_codon:yes gene_type:complete